jgi:hypothetical protein
MAGERAGGRKCGEGKLWSCGIQRAEEKGGGISTGARAERVFLKRKTERALSSERFISGGSEHLLIRAKKAAVWAGEGEKREIWFFDLFRSTQVASYFKRLLQQKEKRFLIFQHGRLRRGSVRSQQGTQEDSAMAGSLFRNSVAA